MNVWLLVGGVALMVGGFVVLVLGMTRAAAAETPAPVPLPVEGPDSIYKRGWMGGVGGGGGWLCSGGRHVVRDGRVTCECSAVGVQRGDGDDVIVSVYKEGS